MGVPRVDLRAAAGGDGEGADDGGGAGVGHRRDRLRVRPMTNQFNRSQNEESFRADQFFVGNTISVGL